MQAISLWLAAAIVILTGWAIVKKYQVNMSELLGVAYTQIRNPDSNLSLLGRS